MRLNCNRHLVSLCSAADVTLLTKADEIMRVERVRVEGFRLLEDVEILLESSSTVIVGRNNSGKTSLADVFDRFSGESSSRFRLEDFSAGQRPKFLAAKQLVDDGQAPDSVIDTLPKIVVTLTLRYDVNEEFGPLSPFVIDLDETSTAALIRMEYAPKLATVSKLFGQAEREEGVSPIDHFYCGLRDTIPKAYGIRLFAVDPTNPADQREFEGMTNLNAASSVHSARLTSPNLVRPMSSENCSASFFRPPRQPRQPRRTSNWRRN